MKWNEVLREFIMTVRSQALCISYFYIFNQIIFDQGKSEAYL